MQNTLMLLVALALCQAAASAQTSPTDSLRAAIRAGPSAEQLARYSDAAVWLSKQKAPGALVLIDEGIAHWKHAAPSADGFSQGIVLVYERGRAMCARNDFDAAFAHANLLDSLLSLPSCPPEMRRAHLYRPLYLRGIVFYVQKNYPKAIAALRDMEQAAFAGGQPEAAEGAWSLLASAYGCLPQLDSAMRYSELAFAAFAQRGDLRAQAGTLYNRGEMLLKNGHLAAAKTAYQHSAAIAKPIGHPLYLSALCGLADALVRENRFAAALAVVAEAEAAQKNLPTDDPNLLSYLAENKMHALAGAGRWEAAYGAAHEHFGFEKKYLEATNSETLAALQVQFEAAQKDLQIALLQAENRRRTLWQWLFATLCALGGTSSALFFRWHKKRRRRAEAQMKAENAVLQERFDRLLSVHFSEKTPAPTGNPDDEFLAALLAAIEQNMADNDFNVEALPRKMSISRSQLFKRIKDLTGKTPAEMLREIRLEKARRLLEARAGTVSEVAEMVGFAGADSFGRAYREHFGENPSSVLRKQRDSEAEVPALGA